MFTNGLYLRADTITEIVPRVGPPASVLIRTDNDGWHSIPADDMQRAVNLAGQIYREIEAAMKADGASA